jgi:DNA-binding NtrC family response regulator
VVVSRSVALIVEDEEMVRFVLAASLQHDGYDVVEAENAQEALDQLRTRSDIAAVVTDVRMPGALNGIDLTRVIASEWPHIRVVVVSGYIDTVDTALPETATFLRKPYLYSALKDQLERRSSS